MAQESKAVPGYEKKATTAAVLGYMLDGMDSLILSLTLSAIGLAFLLSSAEEGLIGFVLTGGMVTGGYIFGILADRYGRVRTFTYSILLYSVFTALTAVSINYPMILVTRFLSGVGTGAEYGIGMTLMSESFRAKWRGMGSTIVSVGWTFGIILATVISLFLMPVFGWRSLYLIGITPAILAFYYRYKLPESPMWKDRVQKKREAQKLDAANIFNPEANTFVQRNQEESGFSLAQVFRKKYLRFTTVFLIIAIVAEMGYWGVMIWLPTALEIEYHITFVKTIYILLGTDLMVIAGMVVFGLISDIIGRRIAISLGFIGITVAALMFAISRTSTAAMYASFAMGFFINSYFTIFGALFSEPYPTAARSTAVNFIFNTGRGFGGIAPLLIGIFSPVFKISGVIGFFAILFIIAAVVIWAIPETRGAILK
ncbi:MAG: MFS transporter [Nitrososphaerota archaeon]|jgi:MFS family permease|nr:MFS transporter [Nitrososphaerota archaeon]MDG6928190.1 MFS transporter [Nitrososphaerota archaeon]MDG6930900.1 MFS transporter [Nitrososphaerota archaeon]MDG6932962.1 MFS transporter [Nitrososphaerota archaeon]MDG6936297.1 MFS transporter [Nitrososphaerota archaeon]